MTDTLDSWPLVALDRHEVYLEFFCCVPFDVAGYIKCLENPIKASNRKGKKAESQTAARMPSIWSMGHFQLQGDGKTDENFHCHHTHGELAGRKGTFEGGVGDGYLKDCSLSRFKSKITVVNHK